jgi:hypothetical protein
MAYARLKYPLPAYNKAGERLRVGAPTDLDFTIAGNWRAAHAFPLIAFRTTLGKRGKNIDDRVLISQRLKRLSSVARKLNRFRHLRLRDIQDIGGCRAVLSSSRRARRLFDKYCDGSLKHELLWTRDYVSAPKESGYRSFHLIYAYKGNDRQIVYDDLKIEIQIRSLFQHAWATAVETVDIFTAQALKSSLGTPEWDRFFRLMSSYIALRERTPLVPDTPTDKPGLKECIRECAYHLRVIERLADFRLVAERFDKEAVFERETAPSYFLLEVQPSKRKILVSPYKRRDLERAEEHYLATEQEILTQQTSDDAVLVSVEKLTSLRKAYPNYYGDTDVFLTILRDALA